jgi:hypothetical protein
MQKIPEKDKLEFLLLDIKNTINKLPKKEFVYITEDKLSELDRLDGMIKEVSRLIKEKKQFDGIDNKIDILIKDLNEQKDKIQKVEITNQEEEVKDIFKKIPEQLDSIIEKIKSSQNFKGIEEEARKQSMLLVGLNKVFSLFVKVLPKSVFRIKAENSTPKEAISSRLTTKDGKRFWDYTDMPRGGGGGGWEVVGLKDKNDQRVDPSRENGNLALIKENTDLPTTPEIFNIAMAEANTDYSKKLPNNTKMLDIKLRSQNALLKVAFDSIAGGAEYITIPYGSSFHIEKVHLNNITIYLQSSVASQICEIVAWK